MEQTTLPEDVERKNKRTIELPVVERPILFRQRLLLTETGGALWDSAVVLNAFLRSHCDVKDLVVFELGSGIGETLFSQTRLLLIS